MGGWNTVDKAADTMQAIGLLVLDEDRMEHHNEI